MVRHNSERCSLESQCTHSAFSCVDKLSLVGGCSSWFRLWGALVNAKRLLPHFWLKTWKGFTSLCLYLLRKYNEMQLRHKEKIRRAKATFIHEVKQRDSRIKQLENELSESKLQVEKVKELIGGFPYREGREADCRLISLVEHLQQRWTCLAVGRQVSWIVRADGIRSTSSKPPWKGQSSPEKGTSVPVVCWESVRFTEDREEQSVTSGCCFLLQRCSGEGTDCTDHYWEWEVTPGKKTAPPEDNWPRGDPLEQQVYSCCPAEQVGT